jgi:thiol-disulfide isomerase/thioredoxin
LQSQYENGDNKGYIAGAGVTEISPDDRKAAVVFSGPTEDARIFSSSAQPGAVTVVNFWYAGCPPCRLEAKDLQHLSAKDAPLGVVFVGVNTRDDAQQAAAYDRTFGITYPSILDADTGSVQLAFSGTYRPNATPTTLVLDRQGRVAARMEGPISAQPSTLQTLIETELARGKK